MRILTSNRGKYRYKLTQTELRDGWGFVLQKSAVILAGKPNADVTRTVLVLHVPTRGAAQYSYFIDSKVHLNIGCREFDRRTSAIILRWAFGGEVWKSILRTPTIEVLIPARA